MEHGAADDDVRAAVGEAVRLDGLRPEARGGQPGGEPGRERAHGLDGRRVRIDGADVIAMVEKKHEVAPVPAPRVEDPHPRNDSLAKDLIEEIDVDRAEGRREVEHGSGRILEWIQPEFPAPLRRPA